MKKRYLFALLGVTALISMALGAMIHRYTLEIPMTMRLAETVKTYGLELLDGYGDPVTSYEWGNFTKGEVKQMEDAGSNLLYTLNNTGNATVYVSWNTSDITVVDEYQNGLTPWELRIDEHNYVMDTWDRGLPVQLVPGDSLLLEIWLIEVSATEGTAYSFDLIFDAAENMP